MFYESLTKKYSLKKTIRNELIPVGRTLENIHLNNILEIDNQRKKDYERVKKLMDDYHRRLIDEALSDVVLSDLEEASERYFENDINSASGFSACQKKMRKEVVKKLKGHKNFGFVGKEEIIEELEKLCGDEENYKALSSFEKFYTYFEKGYNTARKNLYSEEEKSSAVAYRMINENLPKFLDNIKVYNMVKDAGIKVEGVSEEKSDILFFNHLMTQDGINEYNAEIGKVNIAINLHNQKNSKESKFKKIPKMKELYKQILSERDKTFIEEFADDEELIENLKSYISSTEIFLNASKINDFYEALRESAGDKIYVENDAAKTAFSNIVFGSWNKIDDLLNDEYDSTNANKKKNDKYYEKRQKDIKKNKSYELKRIISLTQETGVSIIEKYIGKIAADIEDISTARKSFSEIVLSRHDKGKKLAKNLNAVRSIKELLDAVKVLEKDVKLLNGCGQETDKDLNFYAEQESLLTELKGIDSLYNLTRNYLTKKPFSTDKIKLNFNRPTLLDGWDKNKEEANLGIILLKDGNYYLGIMNTTANKVFVDPPEAVSGNVYKKMNYKQLQKPYMMLPRQFLKSEKSHEYNPSKEMLDKYGRGTHTKNNPEFSIEDCHNLIDYFKKSINKHKDWSKFNFTFSETSSYNDISGFYKEVERQGYKIFFTDIDAEYIESLIDKNELYLFKIHNKDFSPYSTGNYNLHTLYFKMLFDERNLSDVVYKLNGEAEVFYRPASISPEEMVVHKAGERIKNKNPLRAKDKEYSEFNYDIIKDRRYSKDKFFLHLPIIVNFGVDKTDGLDKANGFNNLVNAIVREEDNIRVIGIDRGERNLLYVVVIDSDGSILEQISLNSIINKEYSVETDYHELLDRKEGSRNKARRDWNTIENIKELKEGYLSQVVNVIAKLVLKYNAIICLEDLNFGFKRGRQKVEKQVYQKFEKMLIDKLNYLVLDKSRVQDKPEAVGNVLNALQLTSKFESFKELGKQTGIIYYVPAYMTSKIDPTTGFTNLFYFKYENVIKAKEFFGKFDAIHYNNEDDYFEFEFSYENFTNRAYGSVKEWVVCTVGERIIKYKNADKNNSFEDKIVNITDEIKNLFDSYAVSYSKGEDLKNQIESIDDSTFFKELIRLFHQTLQMRNSSLDGSRDYIISPVKNDRGEFFCSELEDNTTPNDADANGAYNIARKGLWIIEQIKKSEPKLAMSNSEWLEYAQTHRL